MHCLWSQSARKPATAQLHCRAQRGDPARLLRAHPFAGFNPYFRRFASNRLLVAQKKFVTLPALETTLDEFQEGEELELDEIWSFVKRRKNKRWIWLALCRRTRQVVAFAIGKRGRKTCLALWKAIPAAYKTAHCFADVWEAYSKVIADHQLTQSESKANTNHVERFNCTLRQRLGRLVRETFSFSKTDQMHTIVLTLFLYDYNRSKLTL
ncbi:MAG TPA: IS1 family transposase [Bacteriovoracaceae bacterium]|nr:IS1 family transposase [Bacteriovoracaceae bacterium]